MVYVVRCAVCGVRCVVCSVWCAVCGVRSEFKLVFDYSLTPGKYPAWRFNPGRRQRNATRTRVRRPQAGQTPLEEGRAGTPSRPRGPRDPMGPHHHPSRPIQGEQEPPGRPLRLVHSAGRPHTLLRRQLGWAGKPGATTTPRVRPSPLLTPSPLKHGEPQCAEEMRPRGVRERESCACTTHHMQRAATLEPKTHGGRVAARGAELPCLPNAIRLLSVAK